MISETRMHQVQTNMGNKRIKKSKCSLCMSALLAAERTTKRTVIALVPTLLIGQMAIREAKIERGYNAVGGEWMLIIFVFVITYMILIKKEAFDVRKNKRSM